MLERKEEYRKMAEAEEQLWWYRTLHENLLTEVEKSFGNKDINILDAGCGTGGVLKFFEQKGYKNLKGFDFSANAVEWCEERNLNCFETDINDFSKHLDPSEKFDVITCNDVLYFVQGAEQREKVFKQFYDHLTEGGILILNVPALECFRGIHDICVGIPKRFNQQQLDEILAFNLFSLENKYFWPFFLSPIIFVVRFIQRMQLKFSKVNTEELDSDVSVPMKPINLLFYYLTKLERWTRRWFSFGSSMFIVFKKK